MSFKWLMFAAVLASPTATLASSEKSKFAKGDCVQRVADVERWEDPEPIIKILEVGRKKYRTTEWSTQKKMFDPDWESHAFILIDAFNSKVRCPK
jgi:hypothetical protein